MTIPTNPVTSRYVYDASGKRTRKIVSGVETWFVYWLDGELVAEYNANGAVGSPQKEYGYRGGQLLVVYDASEAAAKQLQWLVADHLGTPRMVIDKTGSLSGMKRHDYLPFGEEIGAGVGIRSTSNGYTADQIKQKFAGKERDVETGLNFIKARYYSNLQGRFTSVDPQNIGAYNTSPQSWNGYSYAINSPTVLSDPDGLSFKICDANGNCSIVSDEVAKTYTFNRKYQQSHGYYTQNDGKIYGTDGSVIGSYVNLGCDCWPERNRAIVNEVIDQTHNPAVWAAAVIRGGQYAKSAYQYEKYKKFLRRNQAKPIVSDPKLQETMDKLYRADAKVGSGSTADAIRNEALTGKPTGGVFHTQKGEDMINNLQKWLSNNPNANPNDINAAKQVILDLKDALDKGSVINVIEK